MPPHRRLAAPTRRRPVIAAGLVLAVVAAFGVRALRSDPPPPEAPAPKVVVCAVEMSDVCADLADAAVEVRVESPGDTAARLRDGGALDADAWLAPRPWIDRVVADAADAGRPNPLGEASATLARSQLVMIIRSDRRDVLEAACRGIIDWFCLAQHAGSGWDTLGGPASWGVVRVGIDRPDHTTNGLLALAQMTATFTRRETIDVRDLEPIRSTLETLLRGVPAPGDGAALEAMMERGDSYDLVVALEASSRVAIASPRASGQLEVVVVEPTVTADAVLAPAAGTPSPVDHERVRTALTGNGWRFPDKTGSGVPDAGTIEELIRISDVTRPPR
jgi:Bacterial extracellular solute-binding protein